MPFHFHTLLYYTKMLVITRHLCPLLPSSFFLVPLFYARFCWLAIMYRFVITRPYFVLGDIYYLWFHVLSRYYAILFYAWHGSYYLSFHVPSCRRGSIGYLSVQRFHLMSFSISDNFLHVLSRWFHMRWKALGQFRFSCHGMFGICLVRETPSCLGGHAINSNPKKWLS